MSSDVTDTTAGIHYNPFDADISAHPFPTYRRLRDEAPVFRNDEYDFWALSRHDDVEGGLRDWESFSSARGSILEIVQSGMELPEGVIMFEDPPKHTMHRGLLSRVFTPRKMLALEDQIREYCVQCLDPLVGTGRIDFMRDLGQEMPMRVIGMLLGIPESANTEVRERTDGYLRTRKGKPIELRQDAIANGDMFAEYIDWRAEHPSDDLMTALMTAEFTDDTGKVRKLHRHEVLTYTQVVAGAGNETTGRLIGWLGKVLDDHPAQRAELVADPTLIPGAVEETLRYEPTGPHIARYTTADLEYRGTTIPAGSAVLLLIGSANRDERVWPDPDTFDIHRDQGAHLTFGFGLHFCLGAALARVEARVALEEVLKRFPEWEIRHDEAVMASTSTVRGWESLPATVPI